MDYTKQVPHHVAIIVPVVLALQGDTLLVLLSGSQVKGAASRWYLPTSFIAPHETSTVALQRALHTAAGLSIPHDAAYTEQLYTYDVQTTLSRSTSLALSFMTIVRSPIWHKTADQIAYVPVSANAASDPTHTTYIDYAVQRLRAKVSYTNIAVFFLEQTFTFQELQSVYETILGHSLDKRNFRKKILQIDIITPVDERDESINTTPHRPAKRYRATSSSLHILDRPVAW